ncbi:reverse transcriptase domain-containing protein [Tanacetum coccineum]
MIWLRAETPSTSHLLPSSTPPSGTPPLLPIPLPTPSPPLLLPSIVCRVGVSEVTLLPRKRLCIALGPRYEVSKSSSALVARPTGGYRVDYGFVATLDDEIRRDPERDVGYGITDTWDEMLVGMPGAPATDDTKLGRQMTDFVTMVRQDTDDIYGRLDDAQDDRLLMSCQLNMLYKDRRAHARSARLMKAEARLSLEAWVDLWMLVTLHVPRSWHYVLRHRAPKRTTRANLAATTATTFVTYEQLKEMIDQRITAALAARDANRSMNGNDIHNSGTAVRRNERDAYECSALTWWNSHVRTVGHDVAYAMTWTYLKKKMTDKYCPRGKIKKLEVELWNLKVKGTDVIGYNQRFQELALLCVRMFPKESDKIERYVGGLPDMIHGSVVASKPKTMQEAIEIV